ncbi:hypothetical protein GHK92_06900 [Nocardioides sp. dk4132]|uniref:hypothetical protein n=1 Tax=unclassified Nocardioides TaxID=2615069 RepID=UPI001297C074|nr:MULTISPECIES: hypothetical protein [unclassified Nocardioides]MQW75594.1 hypothetical protein [Nocardioides sp. dk4132]QGA08499.1 hypothetical protein GFH29_14645 [Nocardioides sp. dk884]
MDSTKLAMTAQLPSGYATSACAQDFRAPGVVSAAQGTTVSAAVRERSAIAAIKGGVEATGHVWGHTNRRIDGYFPGTSAWRPPSC